MWTFLVTKVLFLKILLFSVNKESNFMTELHCAASQTYVIKNFVVKLKFIIYVTYPLFTQVKRLKRLLYIHIKHGSNL